MNEEINTGLNQLMERYRALLPYLFVGNCLILGALVWIAQSAR